ncbi:hypothetical protein PR048_032892 [Dryococelus australis]|uniref:Uncharacterized protein n=1 Tax=Dryococelus australis TaxID=614101 RepID=A0ABQ9G3I3_9NEOP|nr:hypothetical protein PR048_032892 [Dryococelus australis]
MNARPYKKAGVQELSEGDCASCAEHFVSLSWKQFQLTPVYCQVKQLTLICRATLINNIFATGPKPFLVSSKANVLLSGALSLSSKL